MCRRVKNGPYAAWITYEVSLFPTDIRSQPSHKLVTVSCSNCAMIQMGQTREAAQELEKCGLHRFIDPCWLIAQAYDSAELYRESFDDLMSKGNCNNCVKKQWCGSAAKPGETVRANCPLYAAPAEEEANAEE